MNARKMARSELIRNAGTVDVAAAHITDTATYFARTGLRRAEDGGPVTLAYLRL
jgi:hypothetical protein